LKIINELFKNLEILFKNLEIIVFSGIRCQRCGEKKPFKNYYRCPRCGTVLCSACVVKKIIGSSRCPECNGAGQVKRVQQSMFLSASERMRG
jgi:predicted Zn-ribbon and HTH transcriptional regulator